MSGALSATVAGVLARYLALVDAQAEGALRGFYLVGSVALNDYEDGRSDIDFVGLLARPIDDATSAALARVHATMSGQAPHLDGFYVDAHMLAALPTSAAVVPCSYEGTFAIRACFETNPAVWRCLVQSGVRVRGPAIEELGIAQDDRRLREFLNANLETYWRGWIADCRAALDRKCPGEDGNAAALAWGVLGTARIACTLATNRIVSKREAGEWALRTFPKPHHDAICDAVAAHRGAVSRFPVQRFGRAFAFMEALIDAQL